MARHLCVFCGNRANSEEHVWPDWFGKLFSGGDFTIEDNLRGDVARRTGRKLNLTVRCVCESCNTGWMSDLEARIKPIVLPILDGQPTNLSDADQVAIAAWAM